jgi:hypothetical protein
MRAGYSLMYIPQVGAVYATGYSNTTPMITTQDGITPKDLLRNPFPNGQLPAIGNSQGLSTLIGNSVSFVDPSDRVPRFHNWHVDLQRQVAPGTLFTVSYVGSRAYSLAAAPTDFTTAITKLRSTRSTFAGTQLLQAVPIRSSASSPGISRRHHSAIGAAASIPAVHWRHALRAGVRQLALPLGSDPIGEAHLARHHGVSFLHNRQESERPDECG